MCIGYVKYCSIYKGLELQRTGIGRASGNQSLWILRGDCTREEYAAGCYMDGRRERTGSLPGFCGWGDNYSVFLLGRVKV